MKTTNILQLIEASYTALDAGRRDMAVSTAREAVRLSPHHVRALICLADALSMYKLYIYDAETGRKLAADGTLQEVIDIRRSLVDLGLEEAQNYFHIGYCLTTLGDYDGAATYIRRATDIFQRNKVPAPRKVGRNAEVLKPEFFIIGSAKCGTTSLFNYIVSHPLVLPPIEKEIDYFLHPERGDEWYFAHFPRRPADGKRYMTGEASVSTISISPLPAKLKEINAAARLIALSRNPVDRAISHYANQNRYGFDPRSLEQAMDDELQLLEGASDPNGIEYWKTQRGYLWLGHYADELERWLADFPQEQLAILITEEMQADAEATVDHVYRFLELPPHRQTGFKKHHKGVYDDQDQKRVRQRLKAYFRQPNEHFYELIGRRLDWDGEAGRRAVPLAASASKGRILYRQGRWREAAEEYQRCLSLIPDHPDRREWLELRCKALLSAKAFAEAKASLAEFASAYPDSSWAAECLIDAERQNDDPAEAAKVLEDGIKRFPQSEKLRSWMVQLGQLYLEMKQWEGAERALELVATSFPDEPLGIYGLAQVAQEKGHPQHAVTLWEICLRRFPEAADRRWWLISLSHLLIRQGQLARAGQIIGQHMTEFPDEASGLSCLALLEQKKSNINRAIELFGECLRRFPDHPDRQWWLPNLANLLIDSGEIDRAEPYIDDLIMSSPHEPAGLVGLARIETKRGHQARAADLWEECLRRFPHNPDRSWWLPTFGHALLGLKQTERGEAQFRQMLDEFPGNPVAMAGLARAASDRGDWQQAIQMLQDSIAAAPDHPNRGDWENMLRNARAQLEERGADGN